MKEAELPQYFRNLRLEKGFTQDHIAGGIGISPDLYNAIENERKPLSNRVIRKLCTFYKLKLKVTYEIGTGKLFNEAKGVS